MIAILVSTPTDDMRSVLFIVSVHCNYIACHFYMLKLVHFWLDVLFISWKILFWKWFQLFFPLSFLLSYNKVLITF